MIKHCFLAGLCAALLLTGLPAFAEQLHTHLSPYSIIYPLQRSGFYSGKSDDLHKRSFGVNRMFSSSVQSDFEASISESQKWYEIYGGYGTQGRGEDVFTDWAAEHRAETKNKIHFLD